MTCNHCSTVSNEAAKAAGAPEVEATWAENRDHPRYCPTCHGFLRKDGGGTRCDGMSVRTDAETIELDTLPAPARRYVTGPIVLAADAWGLPEWLEKAIPAARLAQVRAEIAAGEVGDKATSVEACAYLHGASLMQPLGRDWTEIFIYVSVQAMKGRIPPEQNLWEMLGQEPVERLSADQQRMLDDLLRRLRRKTVARDRNAMPNRVKR